MRTTLLLWNIVESGLSKIANTIPKYLLNKYLLILETLREIPNKYEYNNNLNDLSLTIFSGKYYLKDLKGNPLEYHPEDVYRRVAAFVASVERDNEMYYAQKFFELMREGLFIPGGRVLAGAGDLYRLKTLANCFVSIIEDDSIESIYKAAYEAARTYSYGGGIGIDISVLRPAGAVVHNASNTSTGSVSFMQLYSLTTGLIGQEGRRGALMLTIDVKHPDIINFIRVKSEPNYDTKMAADLIRKDLNLDDIAYRKVMKRIIENFQVRYANISIKFNDEFFSALEEQNKYPNKILVYKVQDYYVPNYTQDYKNVHYSYGIPSKDISKYSLVGVYNSLEELKGIGIEIDESSFRDIWKRDVFGDYVVKRDAEVYAVREAGDFLTVFASREVGEIRKMYKARDIWNLFVIGNYNFAEPGLIFWSKMTKYSNSNYIGRSIIGTNPCSEVPLEDGGACNLGSINLVRFVREPFTERAYIDYPALDEAIKYIVRFMDNVVEWNIMLHPLEKQRKASKETRRVGIGIMGMADMFMALQIDYDSERAIQVLEEVMSFIANRSYYWSSELAKERGSFPLFSEAILESPFIKEVIDEKVKQKIRKDGLRNVALLSIAPTGTISNIVIGFVDENRVYTGVSGGIEPVFSLFYTRYSENLKRTFYVFHPTVKYWLDRNGIDTNKIENEEQIYRILPDYMKRTAHNIDWKMRVKIQSIAQRYIDHSISSTINLPEDIDPETISEIYLEAWRQGLKGVTIYREGSRFAILNTGKNREDLDEYKNKKFIVNTIDGKREVNGLEVYIGDDGKLHTVYHDSKRKFRLESNKKKQMNIEKFERCPICNQNTLKNEGGCYFCVGCGYGKCE
ncbi:MAG: adenosylcobalamin-dependent ribonucleoside-diphosphate reductase [Candidatus Micrarchaeota archaeon]|nr:adenosylcobalamin-dependent ribonucleoside-diphosphate reductase [Candidatus Micrarchaeota archaeon]MCX8154357.1 adenosylcobalamin-dependent ribonucleoside-diphosphate reductase [Candidatus Micrarchaeota archaeon]